MNFVIRTSVRITYIIVFGCLLLAHLGYAQRDLKIKLDRQKTDGPFSAGRLFGKFIENSESFSIDTARFSIYSIWMFSYDRAQNTFKKYLTGNRLDSSILKEFKNSGWDTTELSKTFDNSFYVLVGIKKSGEYVIVPDVNKNRNFVDDSAYSYRTQKVPRDSLKYLISKLPVVNIDFPIWINGHIEVKNIALSFIPKSYFGSLRVAFKPPVADSLVIVSVLHEYLKGTFKVENTNYSIFIHNGLLDVRFNNIREVDFYIKKSNNKLQSPINDYSLYKIGDTLPVNKFLYRIQSIEPLGKYVTLKYVGLNKGIGIATGDYAKKIRGYDILTNAQIDLGQYQGAYLLLDFWGTWCAPCKEILPDLKRFNELYGNNQMRILSIAFDEKPEIVKNYLLYEKINWANIFQKIGANSSDSKIIEDYKVQSYPTTILINPKGKILFRATNVPEFIKLKEFIQKLF